MLDTDRTTTSSTLFQVRNTHLAESLMSAWHQREARFALRYQTDTPTSQWCRVSLASVALTVAASALACLVIVS